MNRKLISSALLVIALGVSVRADMPNKRSFKIFHGDTVKDWSTNPFKFVVALAGKAFCTASIFNSYSLITAGHCFMHKKKPKFAAFEYTSLGSGVSRFIKIKKHYLRSDYISEYGTDSVNGKDIAVVRLAKAINKGKFDVTTLACLMNTRPTVGSEITIIGYGVDSYTGEKAGILKSGKMKLIKCEEEMSTGEPLCMKPKERYGLQHNEEGDSGGPAVFKYKGDYVGVGVSSGYLTFPNGNIIAIYASISYSKEHIVKYTTV